MMLEDSIFVPDYSLTWLDESCVWSGAPNGAAATDEVVFEVHRGHDLRFEIVAPGARLEQLRLRVTTFQRASPAHLWVELKAGDGEILRRAFIDPATVVDNSLRVALDLTPVVLRPGAKYQVSVRAPTATPENALGVYGATSRTGQPGLVKRLERYRNDRTFVHPDAKDRPQPRGGAGAILVALDPLSGRTARLARALARTFPGQRFQIVQATASADLWPLVSVADAVFFLDVLGPDCGAAGGFSALCFELYRRGVCTIFVDDVSLPDKLGATTFSMAPSLAQRERGELELRRCCEYTFFPDDSVLFISKRPEVDLRERLHCESGSGLLDALVRHSRAARSPKVCIVTSLGETAEQVKDLTDRVFAQSYPGPIELILVNDGGGQGARDRARTTALRMGFAGITDRTIRVVDTFDRSRILDPRAAGIPATNADVCTVIDRGADLYPDCVANHVFERARADVSGASNASGA